MYKDVLNNIDGVESYPLFSLFIFVIFFVTLTIYVVTMDKKFVEKMKNAPLDENRSSTQSTNKEDVKVI